MQEAHCAAVLWKIRCRKQKTEQAGFREIILTGIHLGAYGKETWDTYVSGFM